MNDAMRPDDKLPSSALDQVIAACDRFEAAWQAGTAIRIEGELATAPEAVRPRLFGELLGLELELRQKRGEEPAQDEYLARFPNQAASIAAAFAEIAPAPAQARDNPLGDPHRATAHNLLFGLLAFPNGFIGRDALLGALNDSVADRARPIGQLLLDRGALDAARHALLEALVAEHLRLHGGDPEKSLADLTPVGGVVSDLRRLPGAVLEASLSVVRRDRGDREATASWPGGGGSAGERFRILKLHAEGGLGRVYEAHDAELGRKVALKEIKPDKADGAASRSRFVLEAEISGGLQPPGDRASLQPGPVRRRQAFFRHAVRRGAEPAPGRGRAS